MGAIPFSPIQSKSSPVRPQPRDAGAELNQFVVNLGCPFILLSCPQNSGEHVPRPAQLE